MAGSAPSARFLAPRRPAGRRSPGRAAVGPPRPGRPRPPVRCAPRRARPGPTTRSRPACLLVYRTHAVRLEPLRRGRASCSTACAAAGVRTGVVSDGNAAVQARKLAGPAARRRAAIDAVVLTDELGLGHAKPSPVAFRVACRLLDVEPSATIYVGNDPRKDFAGPVTAGLAHDPGRAPARRGRRARPSRSASGGRRRPRRRVDRGPVDATLSGMIDMTADFAIAGRPIGPGHPVYVIAELSANHGQHEDVAVQLVHAAHEAGADAVKLQTYTPDTITIDSDAPPFRAGSGSLWEGTTLHDLYQEAYMPWDWQPRPQGPRRVARAWTASRQPVRPDRGRLPRRDGCPGLQGRLVRARRPAAHPRAWRRPAGR